MNRDGATESIWQYKTGNYEGGAVEPDFLNSTFDVLIIGGGITGISTALLLQQAGKKCILAEAVNLGFGTSGGTTAHLNDFFDTPYYQVEKDFGETNAQVLADAAKEAMDLIRQQVFDYNITCDYQEMDGYLFALDEKQVKELDDIVASAKRVGVDVDFSTESPFPIPSLKMACLRKQAEFHPAKYIYQLAAQFENAGGRIIQQCRVEGLSGEDIVEAKTTRGTIKAANVIYATHIPPGVNILHFRCAPYRSYAVAARLKNEAYPAALGYDLEDPYHYYRSQEIEGKKYLIVGGEDHKTGHEENTEACFRRLESHLRSHYDIESINFHWSSQYFEPTDGLPYIGHLPGNGKNIYTATGFGGNGMIYGTISAILLRDLITGRESKYEKLFNPARVKPLAGFGNFVKEAADVVKSLFTAPFSGEKLKELAEMAAGEAKIVKHEGEKMALYKDEKGQLHAVSSACTHIKCSISWNSAEKSWDCPCHGSRFSIDGEVLTAPATVALEKINISDGQP